jgi:low temperature requirement protein LtrA
VAFGESIVAIGVGVAEEPISWPIVLASALGLAVSAAMWWAYFDLTALLGEHALSSASDSDRVRLARDAYSYLHLPMVAGVVLLALGLKKTLEYVSDTEHHTLTDPLTGVGLFALYGGVAVYLFAQAGFKWRIQHAVTAHRVAVGVVLLALLPFASRVPALAALGVLAGVTVGLIGYEALRFAEARDRVRHVEQPGAGQLEP